MLKVVDTNIQHCLFRNRYKNDNILLKIIANTWPRITESHIEYSKYFNLKKKKHESIENFTAVLASSVQHQPLPWLIDMVCCLVCHSCVF